jgi:hypothetical protein
VAAPIGRNAQNLGRIIAVVFLALAFLFPRALTRANRLWFLAASVLQRVVNSILMALLYVFAVAPTGLIRKALGKDSLNLEAHPEATTYWVTRTPPGPEGGSMSRQF